jgi:alpha-mannosidase
MINEILFVHHTHTDIGYTHPQPVVMELHRRFIDEALDIAERTADYPDDAKFRWTCEVTGITVDWWKYASNTDRDRFLAAVKRGQFEVAGMAWHMTPLMDHSMIIDLLKPLKFFRDLGIPVRSAMNTDVNGLPWGVVDALLDHGITGISMAINEHFGHALRPWPRAFRWQAPGGRTITAYNGFIYGVTSDRNIKVPVDMDEARVRVPKWAKLWEGRGYPHPFLMMQLTAIRYHDNGAPQAILPDFVRNFNEGNASSGGVKLRIGTLSEFFDRIRKEPEDTVPVMRGDWTDWWNFGSGSTAHETTQALRGQRDYADALALEAWHAGKAGPRHDMLHETARRDLALYAEHTWGADRSIANPLSPETRTQQILKLSLASEGASIARMLRRDGLEALGAAAGGDEPRLLVHNPHPFAVKQSLRLPYLPPMGDAKDPKRGFGLEDLVPSGPGSHRVQRQDVVMSDLADDRAYWTAPIEVPGLSYVSMPAADVRAADMKDLTAQGGKLSNGRVTLTLDTAAGGVTALEVDGVNYAGKPADNLRFGVPVLETASAGNRDDIFVLKDIESPDWFSGWNLKWAAQHDTPAKVDKTDEIVAAGRAEISQSFTLANGDKVDVHYRLMPDAVAVEVEAVVLKQPLDNPHGIYLPFPVALGGSWNSHFETGGAAVKLDDEQLPYASRHYITTQRWIRIADDKRELMVACPDAPLWQVGGFTYGRFGDPDGRVERSSPVLLAWLTNNYWMTNFQADQAGRLRFRFSLLPSAARPLGESVKEALPFAHPLSAHLYAERGSVKSASASLLKIDAGTLMLTRLELEDSGVALTFLNPGDQPVEAKIQPGTLKPKRAVQTSLSGEGQNDLPVGDGIKVNVAARAWTRIVLFAD